MKRRLTIARALVNEPEMVLLDEPTTGLDPQARHLVWERLFRLKQQGVTLVLTTHYMDEAEQLCDRLVVMDGGRIVAEGSPRALIERYSTREVVELRFNAESQEVFADKLAGLGERLEVLPDRILLYVADGDDAAAEVQRPGAQPGQRAGAPQQPGGRLPAPDRPDPGGLMTATPYVLEYHLVNYRRTWRSSALSSFVLPLLTMLGFGVGVGAYVTGGVDGVPYLDWMVPGLIASTAMQTAIGESTWPVLSYFEWLRSYFAQAAAPLRVVRHPRRAPGVRGVPGADQLRRVPADRRRVRHHALVVGARHAADRRAGRPRGGRADVRLRVDASSSDSYLAILFRLGVIPMSLFSGVFFPVESLPVLLRWIAYVLPLWHGVDLSRAATLGVAPAVVGHRAPALSGGVGGRRLAARVPPVPSAGSWSEGGDVVTLVLPRLVSFEGAGRRSASMVERNVATLRSAYWVVMVDRLPRAGALPVLHRRRRGRAWSAT